MNEFLDRCSMEAAGEIYDPEILIRCSELVELKDLARRMKDLFHQMVEYDKVRNRVMFEVITRLEALEKAMTP